MPALATGGQCFTSNFYPVALLFKDERGLAKYPLSCHPQGCLAGEKMQERERKMRENHTRGKAESFGANFID